MNNHSMQFLAPAKINLFLHILGRNPNGYHELQTIFQLLNWGDTLSFKLLPERRIELEVSENSIPLEENLVFRAAKLLQEKFNVSHGVKIRLGKRIPMGAGLGGGSSDAGTTFRALNQLWHLNLPLEALLPLGKSLGADVSVFILNHNAWAEGIGEKLTPIVLPKQWYIILNPRVHVSTQRLYTHPELPRHTPSLSFAKAQQNFIHTIRHAHNDFENLACQLYPEIAVARNWLKQFGPARLTGSGGCLFLPVDTEAKGKAILANAPTCWDLMLCESL